MNIPQSASNKGIWVLIIIVTLIHFLPYFILGENSYVRIHDTLEGEWIWLELLVSTGTALSSPDQLIDNVMNGLERGAFPSGLNFQVLLVYLFGSFFGYVINYFIVHLTGFFSMYLLLKTHFLKNKNQEYIILLVSLCFSIIPIYSVFGVSVTAQPLLLYAFLNILDNKQRVWDFLIIVLFPFYTSIVWAGTSVTGILFVIFVVHTIIHKKVNYTYLFGMVLLVAFFLLANYQMVSLMFFNPDFEAHRVEYSMFAHQKMDVTSNLLESLYVFFLIHYHVGTTVTVPMLLAAIVACYFSKKRMEMYFLGIAIIAICLLYGFYIFIEYGLGDIIPFLISFKANRFIILLPTLWFLLFAIALIKMNGDKRFFAPVMIFLMCNIILLLFSNDEWQHNVREIIHYQKKPNYKTFLAEDQFREIEAYIGHPKASYRVASLGMNPSIALHNGFYTLDGLQSIYRLSHKKDFREIIAPELAKDEGIRVYYDGWGNRCYLFSSELGTEYEDFMLGKDQKNVLENFDINTGKFKQMGGRYIFSAVKIQEPELTGLSLRKIFSNPASYWTIHLYEAK